MKKLDSSLSTQYTDKIMRMAIIRFFRPFWFRGKGRLFDRICPSSGVYTETIHGAEFELDLTDLIQRNVFLGVYEPEEASYFKSVLKPGMTVVDVGANIGYFSALGSSLVGKTGKILSFEPSPYVFKKLEAMAKTARNRNVEVFPFGIADESGVLRLPYPLPGNHTPSFAGKSSVDGVLVKVRTLDEILVRDDLPCIDLLKIDVEGFELKVLQGANKLFQSGRIKNIICEFNDTWLREAGASPEQLFQFICERGFSLQIPKPIFQAGGIETLVFASRVHSPA